MVSCYNITRPALLLCSSNTYLAVCEVGVVSVGGAGEVFLGEGRLRGVGEVDRSTGGCFTGGGVFLGEVRLRAVGVVGGVDVALPTACWR